MSLVLIEPTRGRIALSRDATVLVAGGGGFVAPARGEGLFVRDVRALSRWRWSAPGRELEHVLGSPIEQDRWMAYYVARARDGGRVETVELVLRRKVHGDGFVEEATIASYGFGARAAPERLALDVDLDADFADDVPAEGSRRRRGLRHAAWRDLGGGSLELVIEWRPVATGVRARLLGSGGRGEARYATTLRFEAFGCVARPRHGGLRVEVPLAPGATARLVTTVTAHVEARTPTIPEARRSDPALDGAPPPLTGLAAPGSASLGASVVRAFERTRDDLAALRLSDCTAGPGAWMPAAGVPSFLGVFGRDTLVSGIQSAMLGVAPLAGAVELLPRRPEGGDPRARTSTAMYAIALAELWAWTGDRAQVQRYVDDALAGIRWEDAHGDFDGDGLYESASPRSPRDAGARTAFDPDERVVHADGRPAEGPIAASDAQAYMFLAKTRLAQVLVGLGRLEEARRLAHEASELQKRFFDAFWMGDERFLAVALDAKKQKVRSIASAGGHCLAAGLVPGWAKGMVADRLLEPDLYSGWGIRTLSAEHPSYDPYSYHRGSVWPVEQGTIALGLALSGLHAHGQRIARGVFDAAALFAHDRLPEVLSGHPRDASHPFPAIYPRTCWPQAWSSSAIVAIVRSILGLTPNARSRRLIVDPHLPEWLPELTVRDLGVGAAHADLRFRRRDDGTTDVDVLDVRGPLDVVRRRAPSIQPRPASPAAMHAR